MAGQTGNLVPADKKLYALRDVTGTVESIPLISASIMSKKLAAGADAIVLDVKVGSGAFMKTVDDAQKLAKAMVEIGTGAKRKTVAIITDMDRPLGKAIGNALEVKEAIEVLSGHGPDDITEVCITLAAKMLELAGVGDFERCAELAKGTIKDGSALDKLRQMIKAQGGNEEVVNDTSLLPTAQYTAEYKANSRIYLCNLRQIGHGINALGSRKSNQRKFYRPGSGYYSIKKARRYGECRGANSDTSCQLPSTI